MPIPSKRCTRQRWMRKLDGVPRCYIHICLHLRPRLIINRYWKDKSDPHLHLFDIGFIGKRKALKRTRRHVLGTPAWLVTLRSGVSLRPGCEKLMTSDKCYYVSILISTVCVSETSCKAVSGTEPVDGDNGPAPLATGASDQSLIPQER
jgi:hypothetical protein